MNTPKNDKPKPIPQPLAPQPETLSNAELEKIVESVTLKLAAQMQNDRDFETLARLPGRVRIEFLI